MTLFHFLFLRQFCEPDLCGILFLLIPQTDGYFSEDSWLLVLATPCRKQEMVFLDLLQTVHSKKEVAREELHPRRPAPSRFKGGSVSDVRIAVASRGRRFLHEANGQ